MFVSRAGRQQTTDLTPRYPFTVRQVLIDELPGVALPRRIDSGAVHIWLVRVPQDVRQADVCWAVLSKEEKERAARFRFEADQARSIVASGALRWTLSSYCEVPPESLMFSVGEHGKPRLLEPKMALEFNLSHSGDFVLVGITAGRACGVDVERVRPRLSEEAIAERFFCAREVAWLREAEGGFVRLWTAKEAVIKAIGQGLAIPLSDVDVTDVVDGQSSLVTVALDSGATTQLWVRELQMPEGYAGAVAVKDANDASLYFMPE